MTYVVTEKCVDCKFTSCVSVCPVDAFHELPDRLYINPETCIDCNACMDECPVEAIFPDMDVPDSSLRASSLNRRQGTFPCRASARSHNRVLPRLRATDAETTGDGDGEAVAEEDTPEVRVTGALQEFADAGFPSEEGDAVDVVSRTKAMNGAVEDLNSLMDSELERRNWRVARHLRKHG
jgi:ferredoxin